MMRPHCLSSRECHAECHAEFVTEAGPGCRALGHNQVQPQPGGSRCHNTERGERGGAGAGRQAHCYHGQGDTKISHDEIETRVLADTEIFVRQI